VWCCVVSICVVSICVVSICGFERGGIGLGYVVAVMHTFPSDACNCVVCKLAGF
jgi:hypothetical protein